MEKAIKVRGHLQDATHIELDEAISGISGVVDVIVTQSPDSILPDGSNLLNFVSSLQDGSLDREAIDARIRQERDTWD